MPDKNWQFELEEYIKIYLHRLRLPFGLRGVLPTYPLYKPYYQVSVCQATILLLLLLAHTSRCEPCKSLLGSLRATPLVDFHHRRTACPSYKKEPCDYCNHKVLLVRHKGPDRLLRFACRLPPRLPSRSPSDHSLFECSQDIRITLMPSRVRVPSIFV